MIDEFDRDQDGEINAEEFVVRTHRRPVSVRARAHTVRTLPSRVSLHTEQYIMKKSSICE